jgi:WD40 repeat protein
VIALAVGKDGRIAMSGDAYSYQLILWDLEIWEPQKYFQTHSYGIGSVPDIGVAISPDGRRAISASTGGTLILWDLVDPREINRFAGHTDNVTDIAFSQDGRYLLTSSGRENISMGLTDDNTIRLWDIETGEQIGIFEGHEDGITSIDISPDGRQLLSGSGDRSIRLWDVETGQEIRSFVGHGSWVTDVAFMPDGSSGLSGSDDGSIIMWDLERGTWQPFTHYGFDITLAISPDGQKFFSCGSLRGEDQNSVVIWDLEAGYDIGRFWGHDETGVHISPLAVSPNGSYVISGDSSGNLIKWNTTSLDEIHRLKGHNAPISGISISTDGSRAFSCDESGTSRLWDLATGESIGYFSPPAIGEIVRCAISPDGQLAAISVDETIILYKLDVLSYTELLDWIAENRYVRELTCEERELYRIEPLCD